MWPVVKEAQEKKKYELLIANKELNEALLSTSGILDCAIFNLSHLNFLRLVGSTLTQIPEEINNLTNLTSLDLESNNLISLPKSLGKLSKLKLLNVSENKLKLLPEELNYLSSITTINLRNNELEELISFEGCSKLSVLDIQKNLLLNFQEICHDKLTSLSNLSVSANKISEIPAEIKSLPRLKTLNLSENKIKEIPYELLLCSKLKELNLKDNPLCDRRFKKLVESEKGFTPTVLDYLKKNLKDNKGNSESGKSKKNSKNSNTEEVDELANRLAVLKANSDFIIKVSAEVREIRGYLVCCILHNLDLSGTKLKKFSSIQTKLHDTICEKRLAATIATHDMRKVSSPLCYCAKLPDQILIHPLNRTGLVSAPKFLKSLKDEAEVMRKQMKRNTCSGIHKYLSLVDNLEMWPCLVDSKGAVISFPPITNAQETRMENDTSDILIEVTTNSCLKKGKDVMEALIQATIDADLCKETGENGQKVFSIEQVRVLDQDGNLRVVFPSKTDLNFGPDVAISIVRP